MIGRFRITYIYKGVQRFLFCDSFIESKTFSDHLSATLKVNTYVQNEKREKVYERVIEK